MVKIANILCRLNPVKVMVIGDMLLDVYTIGKARRISPEAPVAIVNVTEEDYRPGGAGNVILNLVSLGASVVAIGRIGNDWAGQIFLEKLKSENITTEMILTENHFKTPVKNRIIADHQQIVRIDREMIVNLNESLEQYIIEKLPDLMKDVQVIALSDYGKGFLTDTLLSAIIDYAQKLKIPVITDPKGHDFEKYSQTTVIKPNFSEACAAAKLPPSAPLEEIAAQVLSKSKAKLLMITRSEEGISLFNDKGERWDFPVHSKEVKDVTGAGDTVLAVLTYSMANHLSYSDCAHLCNLAAGIAIEHIGCVRVTLSDLAYRLYETHMTSQKIFDFDHLFILYEILKRQKFQMVYLKDNIELNYEFFQMIRDLYEKTHFLVVCVENSNKQEQILEVLSSLKEAQFIITDLKSLESLSQQPTFLKSYIYSDKLYESTPSIPI